MSRSTRHIATFCCGLGLLATFTPSASARVEAPAPPDWLPPTPAEGARFQVAVGETLRIALVAAARTAAEMSLTIGATGMPTGATLRTTAGNPAGATELSRNRHHLHQLQLGHADRVHRGQAGQRVVHPSELQLRIGRQLRGRHTCL